MRKHLQKKKHKEGGGGGGGGGGGDGDGRQMRMNDDSNVWSDELRIMVYFLSRKIDIKWKG